MGVLLVWCPVSGIRHPASGVRHPASGVRHPASGGHPATGIRPPDSNQLDAVATAASTPGAAWRARRSWRRPSH
ncbi:MAG: hypothetical protein KJ061_20205, partial [Vicinamibacteraceae bacterium]|nr:hypothetical protein [Vicinamibacteraceae bacterium]